MVLLVSLSRGWSWGTGLGSALGYLDVPPLPQWGLCSCREFSAPAGSPRPWDRTGDRGWAAPVREAPSATMPCLGMEPAGQGCRVGCRL